MAKPKMPAAPAPQTPAAPDSTTLHDAYVQMEQDRNSLAARNVQLSEAHKAVVSHRNSLQLECSRLSAALAVTSQDRDANDAARSAYMALYLQSTTDFLDFSKRYRNLCDTYALIQAAQKKIIVRYRRACGALGAVCVLTSLSIVLSYLKDLV